MKQIIKFTSPREHYKADACVVWCFDDRFSALLEELREELNLNRIDQIEIAGGAKDLADEVDGVGYLKDQILKSIELHNTPLVILMIHKECGAYGDLSSVVNLDEFLIDQLKKAKENLGLFLSLEGFNLVNIETYLADFDGLWEVEPA